MGTAPIFPPDRVTLVGVLNLTPDSFSDGSKFKVADDAVQDACRLVEEGADLLDLGGESTRPGALAVTAQEELSRILPVLKPLRKKVKIPLSIDTTKPEVARICLEEGVDIINAVQDVYLAPEISLA